VDAGVVVVADGVVGSLVAGAFDGVVIVVGVGGCCSLSFEQATGATLEAQMHAIRTTLVLDFMCITPDFLRDRSKSRATQAPLHRRRECRHYAAVAPQGRRRRWEVAAAEE
jgi:hypothetical protein